jgi:hypothetical protein
MHDHMPLERSLFAVEGEVHVKVSETSSSLSVNRANPGSVPVGRALVYLWVISIWVMLFLQRETSSGAGSAVHIHNFHLSVLWSMRPYEIAWSVGRLSTSMADSERASRDLTFPQVLDDYSDGVGTVTIRVMFSKLRECKEKIEVESELFVWVVNDGLQLTVQDHEELAGIK